MAYPKEKMMLRQFGRPLAYVVVGACVAGFIWLMCEQQRKKNVDNIKWQKELIRSILGWQSHEHPPVYEIIHFEELGAMHPSFCIELRATAEMIEQFKISFIPPEKNDKTHTSTSPSIPNVIYGTKGATYYKDLMSAQKGRLAWWNIGELPDAEIISVLEPRFKMIVLSRKRGGYFCMMQPISRGL